MTTQPTTQGPELDPHLRLEDLLDRDALLELCASAYSLFGIPVRVFGANGALLADAATLHEVCAYINTIDEGQDACGAIVEEVKRAEPEADVVHPCFTGQAYRITPLVYEGRSIGKIVVGPYFPLTNAKPASPVLERYEEPRLDALLARVPRASHDTVSNVARHLATSLGLIVFSGHKALLTSSMHVAAVTAGYKELEEKNRQLEGAFNRLKELDRLKSNFLATVSHELKTPLTSIIGYSEMLMEGLTGPLTSEQLDFSATIHGKGVQLLDLITGLLDLSKLESGTMTLRRRMMEIHPILHDVYTTVLPQAKRKGVELVLDVTKESCELNADPERLRQVFLNLVDNALKFTPTGGRVTIRSTVIEEAGDGNTSGLALLAPTESQVRVRVEDTGIGIPKYEHAKIFDAFYQVDSSTTRGFGGTGLGLSIVRRLVLAHGGTITVATNDPEGTVFEVTIPSASHPATQTSLPPPPVSSGEGVR